MPERGEKRRLVGLATQNAVEALERERTEWMADAARRDEALAELAAALDLPRPPERIECYDMSNIQGTSVGSMVVFIDGKPEPREYRRFRIRSGETPDDFRMMAEVLRPVQPASRGCGTKRARSPRRCGADEAPEGERRGRRAAGPRAECRTDRRRVGRPRASRGRLDGAGPRDRRRRKGQLSAAVGALSELGITDVPLSGLAKRFEELYVPDRAAPIVLPRRSQALYLVQRIRDEAHRFAITYHRDVRGKRALRASSTTSRASVPAGRRRC